MPNNISICKCSGSAAYLMRQNFFVFSPEEFYAILRKSLIGFYEVMDMKKAALAILCGALTLAAAAVCYVSGRELCAAKSAFARAPEQVRVVIDAGHGGEDGGASSKDGILESRLNLEIATTLRELLHFAGIRTAMVRTEDVSVWTEGESIQQKKVSDLKNRVKLVNETPGALLVSIHQNYFPEAKYHGAQVFYAATPGSDVLAEKIQRALRQVADPENKRQCKKAESVYLMQKASCTAVLVECGFLSNAQEAQRLTEAAYQQRLAAAICGAVCEFLETEGDTDEI